LVPNQHSFTVPDYDLRQSLPLVPTLGATLSNVSAPRLPITMSAPTSILIYFLHISTMLKYLGSRIFYTYHEACNYGSCSLSNLLETSFFVMIFILSCMAKFVFSTTF
jgi:hypothetical protein